MALWWMIGGAAALMLFSLWLGERLWAGRREREREAAERARVAECVRFAAQGTGRIDFVSGLEPEEKLLLMELLARAAYEYRSGAMTPAEVKKMKAAVNEAVNSGT